MSTNPFLAAARSGRNDLWRYAATVVLSVGVLIVGTGLLSIPAYLVARGPDLTNLPAWLQMVVLLAPFSFLILGLWLGLRWLHHRSFRSLLRADGRFRLGSFLLSGGLWLALTAVSDLILGRLHPAAYHYSYDPGVFWPYALAVVLLLPVQVLAEESYFRGYLTQGFSLAGGFSAAWLAPALLFGLLHGVNPEAGAYGLLFTLPVYIGIGLLLGWITLRTAGLEMALGLHLANNLYGAIFVTSTVSTFSGPVLFKQEYNGPVGLAVFLITALLYLLIISRSGRGFFLSGGWRLLGVLVLLAFMISACAPVPASRGKAPGMAASMAAGRNEAAPAIALRDCWLKGEGQVQVKASCGSLDVAEDPAVPDRRTISLNIAVVRAISRAPAPDPIFLLAGGPGQAATEAFTAELFSIERLRFKRDLVLVDQRGTGKSHPLDCPDTAKPEAVAGADLPEAEQLAQMEKCRSALDTDPRLYTTDIAMGDLDRVRQALGYDTINLLGVSYGTRAALTYLRLYPEHTRSLILDGVVPPSSIWPLGADAGADAQRALEIIFQRCNADAACHGAFPNVEAEFNALRASLGEKNVEVTVPHPTGGKPTRVQFNPRSLGATVRLMSYSDALAALLPLAIHSAAQGDYHILAGEYLMVSAGLETGISEGMYYSVICAEDAPSLPAQGHAQDQAGDFYFDPQLAQLRAACARWLPAPAASSGDDAPPAASVASIGVDARLAVPADTPAFLISGGADPVTPPENGDLAAKLLPNNLHLVLPGLGHNNFYIGCVPDLLLDFLDSGSPKGIDTSCTKKIIPQPFFTTPAGPIP